MKKIIVTAVLVLAGTLSSFAQATVVTPPVVRGANQEAFIGYTAGYGPVSLQPTVNPQAQVQENRGFTNGVTLGYTAYFQKSKDIKSNKLGFGIDGNVQFHDGGFVFGTATGGLVYKANADGKVQPFLRVMGGVARLKQRKVFINGVLVETDGWSPAVVGGVGFDVAKNPMTSRLKWRLGVDYVWTRFGDRTQNVWRATTGLVF